MVLRRCFFDITNFPITNGIFESSLNLKTSTWWRQIWQIKGWPVQTQIPGKHQKGHKDQLYLYKVCTFCMQISFFPTFNVVLIGLFHAEIDLCTSVCPRINGRSLEVSNEKETQVWHFPIGSTNFILEFRNFYRICSVTRGQNRT